MSKLNPTKKSFVIKASNRLAKFIEEMRNRERRGDDSLQYIYVSTKGMIVKKKATVEDWLRICLTENTYIPSKPMREIRHLYRKVPIPVDDVIHELMNTAKVADIMDS